MIFREIQEERYFNRFNKNGLYIRQFPSYLRFEMKGCFLAAFFCSWFVLLQAQQITPFEKVSFDSRSDDFSILGTYQSKIAVYLQHNSKADILLFDSKGKPEIILFDTSGKKETSIPLEAYEKNCSNIHFQCTNKSLCVYFEKKEKQTYTLYGCSLKEDLTFSEPKALGSYDYNFLKERNEYQFAISRDHSKVFFYTYTPAEEDFALQALVVNDQLEVMNESTHLLTKNETRFLFTQAVSNNGTGHVLISADLDKKGGAEEVELISLAPSQNLFRIRKLPLSNHYLNDMSLCLDDDSGLVHITGFYADSKLGSAKGIYHCTATAYPIGDFSSAFIPLSISGGKAKMDFRDLSTVRVSLLKDGGIELITERSYKVQSGGNNTMMMNTGVVGLASQTMNTYLPTTQYHHEEISIFNLRKENTLRWSQTVLKDQTSTDDEGLSSSFGCMESRLGKVYLYNELNGRNNRLMASYVSSKGAITLKEIDNSLKDEGRYTIYTRFSYQLNANEILMPSVYKGYLRLLRLHF